MLFLGLVFDGVYCELVEAHVGFEGLVLVSESSVFRGEFPVLVPEGVDGERAAVQEVVNLVSVVSHEWE